MKKLAIGLYIVITLALLGWGYYQAPLLLFDVVLNAE
jgi:hypothetical protein